MKISTEESTWDAKVEGIFDIPDKKLETLSKFLRRLMEGYIVREYLMQVTEGA
jgi:hypothetical protein